MMTPVYNVAIADWKTNNCSVNQYAARLGLSVFQKHKSPKNEHFPPTVRHLFPCFLHKVKKYSFQYFQHTTQPTKKNSLLEIKSSKQDVLSNALNHNLYSSEINALRHCNLVKSGTDVLWQQVILKLKIRKSESNGLRGYIKEQPADDTTTATDEEK